jgi:hypothetical protein
MVHGTRSFFPGGGPRRLKPIEAGRTGTGADRAGRGPPGFLSRAFEFRGLIHEIQCVRAARPGCLASGAGGVKLRPAFPGYHIRPI